MQASELAKNISKLLPVLAALALIVTGLFSAGDMPSVSRKLQGGSNAPVLVEPDDPIVFRAIEAADLCISPYIYTSLPPKCRTADGSFRQLGDVSSILRVPPSGK